jgi:cob(I)alamin adenosyltransferase
MTKIYTKTGDQGETGLVGGKRVSKSDLRIDLYGEVDELNSRLGMASSFLMKNPKFSKQIQSIHIIQSALFDLGSNLACVESDRSQFKLPQLTPSLVSMMESEIDVMEKVLPTLKNFILPGGSAEVSACHLCRTGARNVERKLISFQQSSKENLPVHSLEFINRLSDYFFVLARFIGHELGEIEIAWKSSPYSP